jgi:hypothetical protein
MDLQNIVQTRSLGVNALPDALNALVPAIVARYNSAVGPLLLSRLPTEELPTDKRSASSFRSRVSLLVEYSIIEMFAEFLAQDAPGLNVSFNTLNEFADFFVRDDMWNVQLRIDIKTLHDLSDEASARYTSLREEIRDDDDYLLFLAWQWKTINHAGIEVIFPAVISGLFIPGIEVAKERDLRQILSGGSFELDTGIPLAASGNKDTNFGKMNRIVHNSRLDASILTPRIQQLLNLMEVQAVARTEVPAALLAVEVLADQADPTVDVTDSMDDA